MRFCFAARRFEEMREELLQTTAAFVNESLEEFKESCGSLKPGSGLEASATSLAPPDKEGVLTTAAPATGFSGTTQYTR